MGRNLRKRCHCGSGRKQKDCCGSKRSRYRELRLRFNPDAMPTHFTFGGDGTLTFKTDDGIVTPISADWTFGFDRSTKRKVLGRVPLIPGSLNSNDGMVLKQFDQLLAVDTNTRTIRSETVSVGCVVEVRADYSAIPEVRYSVSPAACVEIRSPKHPPERILWEYVLRGVEMSNDYPSISSLGLLVDSELDALPALNKREESILRDFFVPLKCSLLYASADKGTEWLGYHLIRTCDRVASAALDAIAADPSLDSALKIARCQLFERYRSWDIDTSKVGNTVSVIVSPHRNRYPS